LPPTKAKGSGSAPSAKGITGHRCSNQSCARDLPHQFLARYEEAPALFVPMMGWTGAGKTTFLITATVMFDRAVQIWEDYSFEALTDETIHAVREARDAIVERRLPAPTPMTVRDTYLCHLLAMPRWGSRSWVVRDVPGEHFQKFSIPEEQTSFVAKAKTVLLFVDLAGHLPEAGAVAERRDRGMSIDELLKCYTNSLGGQGETFDKDQGRKVIIVLTKANHLQSLPDNLRSYLERDELQPLLLTDGNRKRLTDYDMACYMERLARVSSEIKEWISTQPGGEALLRHAKLNHIELRFCMIAAIPSGVDSQNVPLGQLDPHRILDPVFWALELNSAPRPGVQPSIAPRALRT
jgi:hypothetical protein